MLKRIAAACFGALALLACSENAEPPAYVDEYWAIAIPTPEELEGPAPVQYINVTSIGEIGGARRAITVAFIAVPPDLSRHGMRMDIVNDYDCRNRRVRPVSTTVSVLGGRPQTAREDESWIDVEERENMLAPFAFVCGDEASRAGDIRFTRIAEDRPIEAVADAHFAAYLEGEEDATNEEQP